MSEEEECLLYIEEIPDERAVPSRFPRSQARVAKVPTAPKWRCLLLLSLLSLLLIKHDSFAWKAEEAPVSTPRPTAFESLAALGALSSPSDPEDEDGCPENCEESKPCLVGDDTVREAPGFNFIVVNPDTGSVKVNLLQQAAIHFELRFLVQVRAPDREVHVNFDTGVDFDFAPRKAPYKKEVVLQGNRAVSVHVSSSGAGSGPFRVKTTNVNFKKDSIVQVRQNPSKDVIFRMTLLTIKPETPNGPEFLFKCESGCKVPIQFENDDICDCPSCDDEELWECDTCGENTTTTSSTTTTTSTTSTTSTSSTTSSTSSTTSTTTTSSFSTTSSSSSTTTSSSSTTTSSSSTTTSSSSTTTSSSSTTTSSSSTTSTSSTTSSSTTSSSTTSSSSTTTLVRRPPPRPLPPPEKEAVIGAAVGTSVAGALGIALGLGLGLAPALAAVFVANGQFTLSVPDPEDFERDDRANRALKKAIAELAGPEVTEAAVTLAFGCIASARVVTAAKRLGRLLQQMLDICFQVELQGEETSEEVCQRLSSFDSTVAARIINRYLAEEGLDPSAVEVVRWNADPNPISSNPSRPIVAPGDQQFTPPSGVTFG